MQRVYAEGVCRGLMQKGHALLHQGSMLDMQCFHSVKEALLKTQMLGSAASQPSLHFLSKLLQNPSCKPAAHLGGFLLWLGGSGCHHCNLQECSKVTHQHQTSHSLPPHEWPVQRNMVPRHTMNVQKKTFMPLCIESGSSCSTQAQSQPKLMVVPFQDRHQRGTL